MLKQYDANPSPTGKLFSNILALLYDQFLRESIFKHRSEIFVNEGITYPLELSENRIQFRFKCMDNKISGNSFKKINVVNSSQLLRFGNYLMLAAKAQAS